MIEAKRIMLFLNAECIPFLLDDVEFAWELAEYAEDLAGRIAKRRKKQTVSGLELVPTKKRPGRGVASTATFHDQYVSSVLKGISGCDGIAVLPGLGKASVTPDWLQEAAAERYIPVAPFASFFGAEAGSTVFVETSRKRSELIMARIPVGRQGRGGRTK